MNPQKNEKKERGVTLIELFLVIAVIALFAGIGVPVYQQVQVRNDLDIAANSLGQSLSRAQVLSQASFEDSSWGVFMETGSITIFRGVSFVLRDSSFDEVIEVPGTIGFSGISEIVFTKLTGEPQTTGTIILQSSINEMRELLVNQKGMVDYL